MIENFFGPKIFLCCLPHQHRLNSKLRFSQKMDSIKTIISSDFTIDLLPRENSECLHGEKITVKMQFNFCFLQKLL